MYESLLLLTGPMRSGTTLLTDLLHGGLEGGYKHPDLAFASDSITNLREITEDVSAQLGMKNVIMNSSLPESFYKTWIGTFTTGAAWEDLRNNIVSSAPTPVQPSVVGLKNTNLLPELLALHELFGSSLKVIVMIRDPRDCFASYLTRYRKMYLADDPLSRNGPFLAFINTSVMLDYMRLELPQNVLKFVRYEDLVAEPERTMRNTLTFLGLDHDKYKWDLLRSGAIINNSSYRPIGPDDIVRNTGLVPSINNASKVHLFYISALEELLSAVMDKFGYNKTTQLDYKSRIMLYGDFIHSTKKIASTYQYSISGLDLAIKEKSGAMAFIYTYLARKFSHHFSGQLPSEISVG